ncbi:MAG: succinate dehydrogenase [Bacteroidota bacterium]
MAEVHVPVHRLRFGQTQRRDNWWAMPLVTLVVFSSFVAYVTWALFQGDHYWVGPYLSPLYSPELFYPPGAPSPHALFGEWKWGWFPFIHYSPAMLILVFPLAFRMTCYYYRGAYYKAFWADPPNCAVGEPRSTYRGEAKLPLIVQNVHRFALYFALFYIPILSWDVWHALWFKDGATGGEHFGVGVGTLVMLVNVVLIGGYTLGCHSLRHLVGGVLDRLSRAPARKKAYDCVSCLNRHHPKWAWFSLFWVGITDGYIRLCAMGVITDWRII